MEEPWNFFEDILPPEVTMMVFSHFSLEDVVYVSLVCKTWNTYFDTKHIWKQIYQLHFGALNESTLDLTAKLKWKRLFFNMASAMKWKSHFQRISTMFTFSAPMPLRGGNDISQIIGRHHVFTHGELTVAVDLKVAAKIVARNSSPLSYYYFPGGYIKDQGKNDCSWKQDLAQINLKDKSDIATLPNNLRCYGYQIEDHAVNKDGRFTSSPYYIRDHNAQRFRSIWDPAAHLNMDKNPPIQFFAGESTYRRFSFNSKYLLRIGGPTTQVWSEIIDLTKKCTHCGWHIFNDKKKSYDTDAPACTEYSDNCALAMYSHHYFTGYALQYNADKVLLCKPSKIDVWMNGNVVEEIPFAKEVSKISWFSEQLTTIDHVTRHWLVYCTNDSTTFIDLNDLSCKYSIPKIDSITWVPKKDKAILVSGTKATVFDVVQRKWQSKMKCNSVIKAMCFNSTSHLLFVADESNIHAYQWETGVLVASVPHECGADLKDLQLGLDQVFCLINQRGSYIYKRVVRCDV